MDVAAVDCTPLFDELRADMLGLDALIYRLPAVIMAAHTSTIQIAANFLSKFGPANAEISQQNKEVKQGDALKRFHLARASLRVLQYRYAKFFTRIVIILLALVLHTLPNTT